MIAVNLVLVSALITVGPVDRATRIATGALAGALPLNIAGIVLLRLIKDVKDIGLDDLTLRAFQDACFRDIEAYFPVPLERGSQHSRRTRLALVYSAGIAALSIGLTVTGMTAALWHMARWIALVLLSSVMLSALLVPVALAQSLPPESEAEKALKVRTAGAAARRPPPLNGNAT